MCLLLEYVDVSIFDIVASVDVANTNSAISRYATDIVVALNELLLQLVYLFYRLYGRLIVFCVGRSKGYKVL